MVKWCNSGIIKALFKSGIRYISAELWVFGISHLLISGIQCIAFPELLITHPKTHEIRPVDAI